MSPQVSNRGENICLPDLQGLPTRLWIGTGTGIFPGATFSGIDKPGFSEGRTDVDKVVMAGAEPSTVSQQPHISLRATVAAMREGRLQSPAELQSLLKQAVTARTRRKLENVDTWAASVAAKAAKLHNK